MKRGYIFVMIALLALVGCTKSDGVESSQSDELRITSEILTRASGTSWDATDQIGVYMAESGTTTYIGVENTLYTPTSEGSNVDFTSTSPLYYPASGNVDILAYYPYSDAEEFGITAYEVDVTDQTKLAEMDLMIATKSKIASTSQALALNFEHKLSQINLTIKLSDGTDLDLTKMSVKLIGTSATATYDLTAADTPISNLSATSEITLMATADSGGTSSSCEAIVIPQELSGAMLLFYFESGESLAATITTTSFAIGQSYSYTATLSHAAANLSGATIGDWNEGNGTDGEELDVEVLTPDIELVDGVYNVYTAAGLLEFADLVNSGSTSFDCTLMGDIDLGGIDSEGVGIEGNEWTPIGSDSSPYSGTFDGGGHIISGLYINTDSNYQGLFGYTSSDAEISNLGVSGSVSGSGDTYFVGGVVGYNEGGTLTNCYNTGSVSGDTYFVGGVVGRNYGTLTNCYNMGSVSGEDSVGGVVGYNYDGTLTNCYNTGDVDGYAKVGGVVGYNSGTLTNCYNTASVSGGWDVGGVVGSNYVTLTNCYNSGSVDGYAEVGGVVGWNDGTVTNCYNTAVVSSSNGYVGGVVGLIFSGTLTNCYNTGSVDGDMEVGGVVGWNYGGTLTDCYYLDSVTSDNNAIEKSETEMQAESFVVVLNNTAYDYNNPTDDDAPTVAACAWVAVDSDYPTLDFDAEPTLPEFN